MADPKNLSFEENLARLENIVQRLENDSLPLEESIKLFEEGMQLSKLCGERLTAAENKITLLLKERDGYAEVPFSED